MSLPYRLGLALVITLAAASLFTKIEASAASAPPHLHHSSRYEVKRSLLEKGYPAFKTFHGSMHAGLIPAVSLVDDDGNERDVDDYSSYFFWLFLPDVPGNAPNQSEPESFRDDTLLIWLNGGPGCSSMVGAMTENGPVTIPKFRPGIPPPNPASALDAPLVENPYAWTKKSAVLFVEQPGGTGFSTASSEWTGSTAEKRTEDDVAQNFYDFLQNFYTVFGEGLREKKLYISGESYAGMYIPSIARGIHLRNKLVSSPSQLINLSGVAIGNGWIDAYIQVVHIMFECYFLGQASTHSFGGTTIDFAFWHGMIDLRTYRSLHQKWDQCVAGEINDNSVHPFHPYTTPDECGIVIAVMEASGSKMMYDVTTYDIYPGMDDVEGVVHKFFNDPDVRNALNAQSLEEKPQWLECVPGSGRRRKLRDHQHRELILLDSDIPSVVPYIAELVDDARIDVLLYNGDLDLACSAQSTEMALESMEWSGKEEWMDPAITPWQQWNIEGSAGGHTKKFNNLEFLVVYNSGHFVPTNQARNALNMIGRFLDGKAFGDVELPQFALSSNYQGKEPSIISISDHERSATIQFSMLSGILGFLLGLLASVVFSRKRSHHGHYHNQSSTDSPFPKTETTPLKHSTGPAV
eukprot:CCRYP_010298-RB/>CCRYP_010298-RB protein AED:0.04 eAED:0.04 QI:231/0.75/0.8/1/0.75/0.8/5/491/633